MPESYRVLIQHVKTSQFLVDFNHWSKRRELAKDFKYLLMARAFVDCHHLLGCQLVMSFRDDPYFDVVLPIEPSGMGPSDFDMPGDDRLG